MPTIEFLGFAADALPAMVERVVELVRDLPFAGAIVLATERGPRLLVDVNGVPVPPFLRVATSEPERASALLSRLEADFDIELLSIRYCPRRHPGGHLDHA